MDCIIIPEIDGNETYCNITTTWKPRFTSPAVWIVPGILAFTLLIISLVQRYSSAKLHRYFLTNDYPFSLRHLDNPFGSWEHFKNFVEMILIYAGLIWDSIDVCLDARYFLDLENPENGVLDSRIYRNENAVNAVYAFALLGILKIPFSVKILTSFDMNAKPDKMKNLNCVLIFIVEDCVENFLEYFYGEKYSMEGQYAWYMIVVDVVLLLIVIAELPTIINFVGMVYRGDVQHECKDWMFLLTVFVTFSAVLAASTIRLFGALYQAITGKIDKGCLQVINGRLIQTPFTTGGQCMRRFEYVFIICNFLPVVGLIILSLFKAHWTYNIA